MRHKGLVWSVTACVLLAAAAVAVGEPTDEAPEASNRSAEVQEKLEQYKRWLDADDRNQRITAAAKLRDMGAEALPAVQWMKKCAQAEQVPAIAMFITRAYLHIEREAAGLGEPEVTQAQAERIIAEARPMLASEQAKVRHRGLMKLNGAGRYAGELTERIAMLAADDPHPTVQNATRSLLKRISAPQPADGATDEPEADHADSPEEDAAPAMPPDIAEHLAMLDSTEHTAEHKRAAIEALRAMGAQAKPAMSPLFAFGQSTKDEALAQAASAAYDDIMLAVARAEAAADEPAEPEKPADETDEP